eukprot:9504061-Pyramimonas_sp.AAC.2
MVSTTPYYRSNSVKAQPNSKKRKKTSDESRAAFEWRRQNEPAHQQNERSLPPFLFRISDQGQVGWIQGQGGWIQGPGGADSRPGGLDSVVRV